MSIRGRDESVIPPVRPKGGLSRVTSLALRSSAFRASAERRMRRHIDNESARSSQREQQAELGLSIIKPRWRWHSAMTVVHSTNRLEGD